MAIYSGFSHWKWWFSIAMLVYQRVYWHGMTWPTGVLSQLIISNHQLEPSRPLKFNPSFSLRDGQHQHIRSGTETTVRSMVLPPDETMGITTSDSGWCLKVPFIDIDLFHQHFRSLNSIKFQFPLRNHQILSPFFPMFAWNSPSWNSGWPKIQLAIIACFFPTKVVILEIFPTHGEADAEILWQIASMDIFTSVN